MPLPIFDNLDNLNKNPDNVILDDEAHRPDFMRVLSFLKSYTGSLGTYNSYRREVERLLHWCWHIKKTTLPNLKRDDIEHYIRFCQNPPLHWIGTKKVPKFIETSDKRTPNPLWRPFLITQSKMATKHGESLDDKSFNLAQGSITEIFAILSTMFNFLIAEEYLTTNPVALIRQKSKFVRKRQQNAPVRRLSLNQWQRVLDASERLAAENPEKHERTRFILSILYGMYLRISELSASPRWIPTMNDFAKDSNDNWWFTTVGKGNKERQIAVSDAMLKSLIRWRTHLGLLPLPNPADNSPLIPRIRGTGPLSDTAPIRRLVQLCFDLAVDTLKQEGEIDEAHHLEAATVHWLRHTGISEDVKVRPREHVRDDAGHSSSATTDRYIDVEMKERHLSAKKKLIEIY